MAGKGVRDAVARRWGAWLALVLLGGLGFSFQSLAGSTESHAGLSAEAAGTAADKLRQVREAAAAGHSFGTVRLSETEANSYLHYEMASAFPPGVSDVRLQFQPNRVRGTALLDFDKLKAAPGNPPNPIAEYLLRGVHTLEVEGTLYGSNGVGQFELEAVSLDGVPLPPVVIELLMERYLKARYPKAAVERPFRLPFSIHELSVEDGSLVVTSRRPERL